MELRELLTQVFAGSLSAQIELIRAFQDCGYNIKIEKIKEKKKMLNIEKYWPEIETLRDKYKGEGEPYPLQEAFKRVSGDHNEGIMPGTIGRALDWLFSEYEPPLLEDGDGLKPGDWIMVRDNDKDDWEKKVFIGYLKGYFYCASELFGALEADAESYSQARLPEDGE